MKYIKLFESFEENSVGEIYNKLMGNCKPFIDLLISCYVSSSVDKKDKDFKKLQVYSKMPMFYRGVNKKYNDIEYKKVRKDRQPLTMSRELTDDMDDKFFEEFKIRPRRESVFVTNSINVAETYGHVYMAFPIGNFKYIYSNDVYDLYDTVRNDKIDLYGIKVNWYEYFYGDVDTEYTIDKIAINKLQETDVFSNMSQNDIDSLIHHKQDSNGWKVKDFEKSRKYVIHELDNLMAKVEKEFLKKLVDSYTFNENLCSVIGTKSEVMVLCDDYYLVNYKYVNKLKELIYKPDFFVHE